MKHVIKRQVWILIYLSGSLVSMAQKKYLQVGDTMPDIVLSGMMNYTSTTARISDFRGKLLIIDFWDRGCTGCIESFPKMEALQARFSGQVQIITATKNSRAQIDTAFAQPWMMKRKLRLPALPSIMSDTAISGLFAPFYYVPQHIWIDKNGKILYITHGYNATPTHIQAVLDGHRPFMLLKSDIRRDALQDKPLTTLLNESTLGHMKYSSLFMNYSDEFSTLYSVSRHVDSARGLLRMNYMNMSVLALLQEAYTDHREENFLNDFSTDNRIDWQVDGRVNYIRPKNYDSLDEWTIRNCYSYEQVLPLGSQASRWHWMQEDLNRYLEGTLGIRARLESVRKKCLVLVCTHPDLLKAKGTDPEAYSYSAEGEKPEWRGYANVQIKYVRWNICYDYASLLKDEPLPFIDETHFTGGVDLRYQLGLSSIDALNGQLAKYGLKIITAERTINLLRIEKATEHDKN